MRTLPRKFPYRLPFPSCRRPLLPRLLPRLLSRLLPRLLLCRRLRHRRPLRPPRLLRLTPRSCRLLLAPLRPSPWASEELGSMARMVRARTCLLVILLAMVPPLCCSTPATHSRWVAWAPCRWAQWASTRGHTASSSLRPTALATPSSLRWVHIPQLLPPLGLALPLRRSSPLPPQQERLVPRPQTPKSPLALMRPQA